MEVKKEFLECVQKDTVFNQEIKTEIVDINPLLTFKIKEEANCLLSEVLFFNSKHVSTMQNVGTGPSTHPLDLAKIKSNDSNLIKQEFTETEYIVPKAEPLSSLLSDYCDLPTIKSDIDLFKEPFSSKQHKEINEQSKKFVSKQKVKTYLFHPVSRMGYRNTQRRFVRPRNYFWKRWLACKICGHFYINNFEYFTHSFNHAVKMNTSHLLNSKTKKPLLKTYKNCYSLGKKSYMCKKKTKHLKKILLIEHFMTDQNLKCKIYRKQFSQMANLNKHLRIHTGETLFKCEICLKHFTRKLYLNKHLKIHAGEKLFKCEICFKQFTRKQGFQKHLRIHTGEKPFKCEICLKQFKQKSHLSTHLQIHNTDEKLFQCEICSKYFAQKHYLKNHLKMHAAEKPFKCRTCLKQFTKKTYFINHLRIHTGETPFKCAICSKEFRQKYHLNAHLKIHTDEKLFQCEICSKCFAQKHYLKNHLKMHAAEKPFKCEICLKQFTQKSDFNKHLRIHTGEKPFKCEICLKRFVQMAHLKEHLKVHLKTNTGEKPFKCEICLKQFTLKRSLNSHLKIHTGENPFKCETC